MKIPFVFRCDHDEMVAGLKADKTGLEKELHRLKDLIFKNTFGVQIHDTLPERESTPQAITVPAPQEEVAPEDQLEIENQRDMDRLRVTRRNNPSRLGSEMSAMMAKRALRMAEAAHPIRSVTGSEKVKEVFDQARKEVS